MFKSTRRVTTGITESKQSDILADEQVDAIVPYEIFKVAHGDKKRNDCRS